MRIYSRSGLHFQEFRAIQRAAASAKNVSRQRPRHLSRFVSTAPSLGREFCDRLPRASAPRSGAAGRGGHEAMQIEAIFRCPGNTQSSPPRPIRCGSGKDRASRKRGSGSADSRGRRKSAPPIPARWAQTRPISWRQRVHGRGAIADKLAAARIGLGRCNTAAKSKCAEHAKTAAPPPQFPAAPPR